MIVDIDVTIPFTAAFEQFNQASLADSILHIALGSDEYPSLEEDVWDIEESVGQLRTAGTIPDSCFVIVSPHTIKMTAQNVPILAAVEEFCREYKASNISVADYVDKFEALLDDIA